MSKSTRRSISSRGGADLSRPDPISEWRKGIECWSDFITDPDGQRRKLDELDFLALRMRQVQPEEAWEMSERTEAARLWALIELEEADGIGMFEGRGRETEGEQRYAGGKWAPRGELG